MSKCLLEHLHENNGSRRMKLRQQMIKAWINVNALITDN